MAQHVCKRIHSAGGKRGGASKEVDSMLETVALQIAHWEKKREGESTLAAKRKARANHIFTLQEEITKTKINTQDTLASNAVCAKVYVTRPAHTALSTLSLTLSCSL